jgi:thiamine phosphate synthase YjbQ (UPF0047 family)
MWKQHELELQAQSRGCHLITDEIVAALKQDLKQVQVGLLHLFSMSVTGTIFILI